MIQNEDYGRVFVIANYWDWGKFNILSLLIRIVCFGWNHVAREKDGIVYEMKGSNWKWIIRKLFKRPVSYEANQGSGYTETPLDIWLTHANRKVIELEALVPLNPKKTKRGYGFLDLIQGLFHIIRRVWLMTGNDWNGTDGCRFWPGDFCTEKIGNDYDIPDSHLLAPINYLMMPEYFRKVRQFTTTKTK